VALLPLFDNRRCRDWLDNEQSKRPFRDGAGEAIKVDKRNWDEFPVSTAMQVCHK
jgi:hypothetical protein